VLRWKQRLGWGESGWETWGRPWLRPGAARHGRRPELLQRQRLTATGCGMARESDNSTPTACYSPWLPPVCIRRGGRRQSSADCRQIVREDERKKTQPRYQDSRARVRGTARAGRKAADKIDERALHGRRIGWLVLRLRHASIRRLHRSETRRRPSTSSRRPARPPAATARRA
jgi:hypothetical protein